jgi:hypothetical protein
MAHHHHYRGFIASGPVSDPSWMSFPGPRIEKNPPVFNISIQKFHDPASTPLTTKMGSLGTDRGLTEGVLQSMKDCYPLNRPVLEPIDLSLDMPASQGVDGFFEYDHRATPYLDRIEERLLRRDFIVFIICIETTTDPPPRRPSEIVIHAYQSPTMLRLFILAKEFNELMEEYAERLSERIVPKWIKDHEFFPRVLGKCFSVEDMNCIGHCNVCYRIFYKQPDGILSICQDCMETFVGSKCDERVARVMSEVSGHIVGLSTDEEMRSFAPPPGE